MKQGKKTLATAAIALAVISGIHAGSSMAYFTTYATARGGHEIELGPETQITEQFSNWTKHISLANTENMECYVRIKVFAGMSYELEYTGSSWSRGEDGYWYYERILSLGETTDILDVRINLPQVEDELGNRVPYTEDFNVVVIQECTAVLYTEEGVPYADWESVLESGFDRYDWEEGGAVNEE